MKKAAVEGSGPSLHSVRAGPGRQAPRVPGSSAPIRCPVHGFCHTARQDGQTQGQVIEGMTHVVPQPKARRCPSTRGSVPSLILGCHQGTRL